MTTLYVDNIAPNLQSKISAPNLQLPSGSVLNVYEDNITSRITTSSTTWQDTGLSITLTPTSSSSKFLITMDTVMGHSNNNYAGWCKLEYINGASAIGLSYRTNYLPNSVNMPFTGSGISLTYLHSPATTNSITYKIQFKTDNGSAFASFAGPYSTTYGQGTANNLSALVIQEIAG